MSDLIPGSNAPKGSSSNRTLGDFINACAMAKRCCIPPDNSCGYLLIAGLKPTASINSWALFCISFLVLPNVQPNHLALLNSSAIMTFSSTVK